MINTLDKSIKELGIKLDKKEIEKVIEIPPYYEMGDYAFPCFILAPKIKESPHLIARQIREKIGTPPEEFEDIQVSGPYVNFFVNKRILAANLVKKILSDKTQYGKDSVDKKTKTMVEFSQPNTHKAFHVGHIRGTSLGESIARILEFEDIDVIRVNYQGDSGMHVAKWLWCYMKYHSKEKLKEDESWIASIYIDAVKRLNQHKSLQREVDEINRKLETGEDKELNELWRKTRKLSLESFEKIYSELNTGFDEYFFEKDMEEKGKKITEKLLKKGIAKKSKGAIIVNLEKYKLGIWVLMRKDGTVLYSAKDLALAEKKFKDFPKIDSSLYVIANEQDLHLQQLVKTLKLMKFKHADKINHVSYGMIRLPHGKMSSRTGENILYSEFMHDMMKHTKKEIRKRNSEISKEEIEERAQKVAIAAIKYPILKQNPNKNIIFDKKEALNFEGDSGAYIQYSYARANSILKKAKSKGKYSPTYNLTYEEIKLTKKLSQFPDVVLKSYKNLNPSHIANYSFQLSQTFNEFYHACKVIGSEQEKFRLSLIRAFKQVMENSLELLGIEPVEEM